MCQNILVGVLRSVENCLLSPFMCKKFVINDLLKRCKAIIFKSCIVCPLFSKGDILILMNNRKPCFY